MNARKFVKKIATVGLASGLMVGATMMGAFAASTSADLGDLPAPFVENGMADFQIVLGEGAAVQDVLGAIDISNSFQAASVTETEVSVPGSSTDYSVSEGLKIAQAGDDLNYQEAFDLANTMEFDRNDFPERLADGSIQDEDENEEWDYSQEIRFNSTTYPRVTFGIPDSDIDLPQLYVDFSTSSTPAYQLVVDFDEAANLSALTDSESIEIFGKVFTFDPANDETDTDVILFGSDLVAFLELNVPQTLTIGDETVEVEVVGANSEGNTETIVLSVNGDRETVSEGQSRTIGGIEIFIDNVFVTNIPTLDASATVFVGSEEYSLRESTSFNVVELNGNDLDGVYYKTVGDWDGADELIFELRPGDFDDDADQFLLIGESAQDPMFDIELSFAGVTPALDENERSYVEIERSSDEYQLSFTNREGEVYEELTILEQVSSADSIRYVQSGSGNTNRLVLNQTEPPFSGVLAEDDFFFTIEGSTTNPITKVYYVDRIEEDNNVEQVVFTDFAGGTEIVEEGETLGSTGLVVNLIDEANNVFNFTKASAEGTSGIVDYFVTEGDLKVVFGAVFNSTGGVVSPTMYHNATGADTVAINWTFMEDFNNRYNDEDEVPAIDWTISFIGDDSDEDIEISTTNMSSTLTAGGDGEYDDFEYSMTKYGTYIVRETENSGEFYRAWYPANGEADYSVFLTPKGATVSMSSSSGGNLMTQQVNPVAVGAAVLDRDVNLATASANIIAVGGPCINSVSAELMGNPAECSADFEPGKAVIELFDLDNGKVAMLVAGWEALETQAASRAVATQDSRLAGDAVELQVTTLNSYSISAKQ